MINHKILANLVQRLKMTDPEKIILFGSHAYGIPNENSDIDILVITNNEKTPSNYKEKSQIYLNVSKTISDLKQQFPIDLIVHTKGMHKSFLDSNSLFAREISQKGKILYEKNNK
ncbi:nucleotidyltransferase domain-containing protein [Anaerophaga thermohalophila]|uniref:nucleotidyltransferase domain-containing protein n=1 Tax=Anaerophaga thermohalophila TaxID=177400 RepID=UPI000237D022|nr:nucleotidyltransferase domain-containing protein [Anaerophaga thermohalophila]